MRPVTRADHRSMSRKSFLRLTAVAGSAFALSPAAAHADPARTADHAQGDDFPDRAIAENEVRLWPGEAPGSEGLQLTETITERSSDPKVRDRAITGVSTPSILPFLPRRGQASGAAALVLPGGGYRHVTFDKEGLDIARWLNSLGVAAFVLKYRLPGEGHRQRQYVPLQDAQRATRVIRHRAGEWGVDATRVGAIGFSAGGHAAATLATRPGAAVYEPVDAADQLDATPGFLLLGYPVISMKDGVTHVGSRDNLLGPSPSPEMIEEFSTERHVTALTPRTFTVQTHDDSVSSANSVLYYEALKAAGVEAETHIFRAGGHGYGIRNATGSLASWPGLAGAWMQETGIAGGGS